MGVICLRKVVRLVSWCHTMRPFALVFLLLVPVVLQTTAQAQDATFDVLGKIKNGFQMAGKLFGFNHAKSVADLVSEAFGKTHRKTENSNNNIFSGFLRVLGFDTKKISAIAVNAIIFVAQLISSSFSLRSPSQLTEARQLRGSPFDWIMNNSKLGHLLDYVNDRDLPEHIVDYVQERSVDEETGCIQLLVCKAAPFVWGMQKSVLLKDNSIKGPKVFFEFLPELDDVAEHGDLCEQKHPYCRVDLI